MVMKRIAIVGYFVFLIAYSIYKYSVDAPEMFSTAYLFSVVVLVLLTGVAPFLLTFAVIRLLKVSSLTAGAVGVVVGVVLCTAGYAGFFALFIAGNVPDLTVFDVAMRGVGWGLVQGVLAGLAAQHFTAAAIS